MASAQANISFVSTPAPPQIDSMTVTVNGSNLPPSTAAYLFSKPTPTSTPQKMAGPVNSDANGKVVFPNVPVSLMGTPTNPTDYGFYITTSATG